MLAPLARALGPTLGDAIAQLAQARGCEAALIDPEGPHCTFEDLHRDALALGHALQSLGLQRGDRIVVVVDHGIDDARALIAAAASACAMPVGRQSTEDEYATLLSAGPVAAVVAWEGVPAALQACVGRRGLPCLDLRALPRAPGTETAAPRDADELAFVVSTSGSTSAPKRVPITHSALMARARKTRELLGIDETDRCLCLMPLQYVHGIGTGLLSPLLCGGAAILPRRVDPQSFFAALAAGATWLTAGATHQQAVLRWVTDSPQRLQGHRLRFVRSGSSSLPQAVAEGLEVTLGVPVFESYSASETGNMTANSPWMGRRAGTVGRSHTDDIAILNEQGARVPPGVIGEVAARGESLSLPYEGGGEPASQAFRDGWFRTGDLGEMDAQGYLSLRGRIKEQINRGGQKISPAELDLCALSLGGVADAAAFPVPHPTLGEDVCLAVVCADGSQWTEPDLMAGLARKMSASRLPRRVLTVAAIPRSETGKVRRRDLAAHFAALLAVQQDRADTPLAPLEQRLLPLWREVLRRPDLGPLDNFFDQGGDSLLAVDLAVGLGGILGGEVDPAYVAQFPTVSAFAEAVCARGVLSRSDTLSFNAEGARTPIFALPGRFGHALSFAALQSGLGSDQPLHALQPPGMDWEAAGCRTVEEMAAHYVVRMLAIQPRGPFQLFGSSFGGIVAFEIARQLQQSDHIVSRLALLDSGPPNMRVGGRSWQRVVKAIPGQDEAPGSKAQAEGQRVAASHAQARATYTVTQPFEGQITYLLCTGEPVAAAGDSRRHWRRLATQGLRVVAVPGRHAEFHVSPQREAVVQALASPDDGHSPSAQAASAVFWPRYRLRPHATQHLELRVGPSAKPITVSGATRGGIDLCDVSQGRLRIRGWAVTPTGHEPVRWLLVFVNGRFLGRVGTGRTPPGADGDGMRADAPPEHSGFWARLPLPRGVPPSGWLDLSVLATQDGSTAWHVGSRRVTPESAWRRVLGTLRQAVARHGVAAR